MRPTTGGAQTPTGPPVAYGPSDSYPASGSPDLCVAPAQWGDQSQCENEVRDWFQGPMEPRRTHHDDSDDQEFSDLTSDEVQIASASSTFPPNTVFKLS